MPAWRASSLLEGGGVPSAQAFPWCQADIPVPGRGELRVAPAREELDPSADIISSMLEPLIGLRAIISLGSEFGGRCSRVNAIPARRRVGSPRPISGACRYGPSLSPHGDPCDSH